MLREIDQVSTEDAATIRLRVHQFAKLRGVSVRTVWIWIDSGKVVAEKDEGGRRWFVMVKINNERERKQALSSES